MAIDTIHRRCPKCGISASGTEAQLNHPTTCTNCHQTVTMERAEKRRATFEARDPSEPFSNASSHQRPSEPGADTATTRDRRGSGPFASAAERASGLPQIIGLVGSAALIGGAFGPFISVPLFGNITLFQGGEGDGVIIVVLATIGLTFALLGRLAVTAITGVLSGIVLIYTFNNVTKAMGDLNDNPFGAAISFQWGLALVLIGIVLSIAAPFMKRS